MALVPPLTLAGFDLTPSAPYFATAFGKDPDGIDALDSDLADVAKDTPAVDLVLIALQLNTPLDLVDAGLAFEDTDTNTDPMKDVIAAQPNIDTSIKNNETTLGKIPAAAAAITTSIPPIAGVPVPPTTTPPPPPAPKLPPVGGGIGDAPLPGTHARITNINRPGAPGKFRVGDPWQITIEAPAGTAIYAVATHNRVQLGQASFGIVPAAGVLVLTGAMTADQIGSWQENWYAGTHFISQIVFTVE
jgi:hypothetical protein